MVEAEMYEEQVERARLASVHTAEEELLEAALQRTTDEAEQEQQKRQQDQQKQEENDEDEEEEGEDQKAPSAPAALQVSLSTDGLLSPGLFPQFPMPLPPAITQQQPRPPQMPNMLMAQHVSMMQALHRAFAGQAKNSKPQRIL
eukprot:gb/GEZN01023080.1/.p1 GENE.gb/GEZN01023080.1/~~gb/GEZN01023080.1/.p1  ORF type:complete len:154 (-),score=48.56 gb/GEZN01023080.1/:143-574(-)